MATRKTTKRQLNELAKAVDFVSIAQKPKGEIYQKHVILQNNYILASDGVITAGHPIGDNVRAIAHSAQLLSALKQCNDTFSITQESDELRIISGPFSGSVACLEWGSIPFPVIAPRIGDADDNLAAAMAAVAPLADEKATTVHLATVLLNSGTATATDGRAMLQYWHGIDMPDGIIISRQMAKTCGQIKKPISGFGYNQNSFSIYFEDGSFIQSQCYKGKWPNINKVLDQHSEPDKLPEGFYDAVNSLKEFAGDFGMCTFVDEGLMTGDGNNKKSSFYKLHHDLNGVCLNINYFKSFEKLIDKVDFKKDYNNEPMMIFGKNVRGAITKFRA